MSEKEYQDTEIICVDCQREFTLTKGEQWFFDQKEFPYPKRCKDCRRKRKRQER